MVEPPCGSPGALMVRRSAAHQLDLDAKTLAAAEPRTTHDTDAGLRRKAFRISRF